jgi:SAM-dependent methyltransferase
MSKADSCAVFIVFRRKSRALAPRLIQGLGRADVRPPASMSKSRTELARLVRLRELFLDEERGFAALPDYWRDDDDLLAYDRVLGARIGWKWDAVLAECRERGFRRADDASVLDFGCGTGTAARCFAAAFGAREVWCFDRAPRAAQFACRSLRALQPTVASRVVDGVDGLCPDVLLVSHVLGELDAAAERQLLALVERSRRAIIVEPGSRAIARRLSALRAALLPRFRAVAPCPHQGPCPALARETDWCHFFAPPPARVFTDGDWVRTARALGIDSRALPYSFLALERDPAADQIAVGPRLLGRPEVNAHSARVQACTATDLLRVELAKRRAPELWRALKKKPASVRHLPPGL